MTNRIIMIIAAVLLIVLAILVNTLLREHGVRADLDKAVELLGSEDPYDVAKALDIFDKHCARALPVLLRAIDDEDEIRRANAVNVLGTFESHLTDEEHMKVVGAVTTRLDNISSRVRIAAILVLTKDFGHAGCSGKLEKMAEGDADISVRMAALDGLGHIAGGKKVQSPVKQKAVRFLAKQLENNDDRIVMAASHALGLTDRADALQILLDELQRKRGLAVHREQLIAVASLGGVLKGGEFDDKVRKVLDGVFNEARLESLLIQAHADTTGGVLNPPTPEEFMLELLRAYHKWDKGARIERFFERIRTTTGEERALHEDAVSDFIREMLSATVLKGEGIEVIVEMDKADTELMLFICGKLINLLETDSKEFARRNLEQITRLNFGCDVVKWREQHKRWTDRVEEFRVEPLVMSRSEE